MELTGAQLLPVARQRVWNALMNTEVLRASIPGCESIEVQGEGNFVVQVVVAVGPVKARFKGKLKQHDLRAPEYYTLSFEGDGGVAGFTRGRAEVRLSEGAGGAAQTQLDYRAQAEIGGRLAQIGSRLIDATAARLSKQFFERLTQIVIAPPADAAQTAAQPSHVAPAQRTPPVAIPTLDASTGARALVTLQMPAWTWAFTVTVIGLLSAWHFAR